MTTIPDQPTLAQRLSTARATLRSDISVSRHLFQGQPSYMLHDPVSFQNHRLSLQDYKIVAGLDEAKTLEECFQQMAASGDLSGDQEDGFYKFVVRLQSLGVLSLPASNGPQLYERYKDMQKKKRSALPMQLLFLRIPLARPDAFLDRTAPLAKVLFTRWFVPVWFVGLIIAAATVFTRRDDFFQPINGMLTTSNFLILGFVLLLLKVWHELGHGYACKIFGGRVPEMGMILMMGAPLAYVDASAAWTFPKRRHRLMVMIGGMYFESLFAILAVGVWAMSGPATLVGSIAYQVVFMATAITVLFNANPLMKYDGYFILSDLLGIPNLRQRAINEIAVLFKRKMLSLKTIPKTGNDRVTQMILLAYGIAASIYRIVVFTTLATILASHAFILGMMMGAAFLIQSLGGALYKFVRYLWYSEETASVRPRAYVVSGLLLGMLPLLLLVFPVIGGVRITGVASYEDQYVIRAAGPGFIADVHGTSGQQVRKEQPLLRLDNPDTRLQFAIDRAMLQRAELQLQSSHRNDQAKLAQLRHLTQSLRHQVLDSQTNLANLVVYAAENGRLVSAMTVRDRGRFVAMGEPLATVIAGKTHVHAWLSSDQMRSVSPAVGDNVSVRFLGARFGTVVGQIKTVADAAQIQMDQVAVTHIAGGDIPVDPVTGRTIEPLVKVTIELPESATGAVHQNSQVSLSFRRRYEPVGFWMARRLMLLINKLSMS